MPERRRMTTIFEDEPYTLWLDNPLTDAEEARLYASIRAGMQQPGSALVPIPLHIPIRELSPDDRERFAHRWQRANRQQLRLLAHDRPVSYLAHGNAVQGEPSPRRFRLPLLRYVTARLAAGSTAAVLFVLMVALIVFAAVRR